MSLAKIKLMILAVALTTGGPECLRADGPVDVPRADAMRAVVTKVLPTYSDIAKQLKLKGVVEVEVSISEDGGVDSVSAVSGNPVLFNCAREAVKRWKFTPFKVDAKPVKAKTVLSFSFAN